MAYTADQILDAYNTYLSSGKAKIYQKAVEVMYKSDPELFTQTIADRNGWDTDQVNSMLQTNFTDAYQEVHPTTSTIQEGGGYSDTYYQNLLAEDAQWTEEAIAATPNKYYKWLQSLTPEQQQYLAKNGQSMYTDSGLKISSQKAQQSAYGDTGDEGTSTDNKNADNSVWGTFTQTVGDMAELTGTDVAVEDNIDLLKGAGNFLQTGDVSDLTDPAFKSVADSVTLNQRNNSDTANQIATDLTNGLGVLAGGTISATQAAADTTNAVNALYQGNYHDAAQYLQKLGISVDEAVLGSGTFDINYLADVLNENNTGDSNGAGSVGFTQNVLNAIGQAATGDTSYSTFNTDELAEAAKAAGEASIAAGKAAGKAVSSVASSLGNVGSTGGDGSESSIFSNADEVNSILTNGTRAAQQTYGEQTATALQPLTEAKDAYNYTDQLDNYNQDWENYKEQTASNNAYLDTQKDAAQNWETYMNPLTDYLNEQLAKNQRRSAGSMLGSSANEALVNQAIATNTATQYQNAVNNALADSQNNQNIANSQQNNSNSYLSGSNQTLTNNVTPTTDWTAYMSDFADTNLNANNNLVNAQAQIASQEPTTWDNISDVVSAGVGVLGTIASWF